MKPLPLALSWVFSVFDKAGIEVYLVGGAVRDLLLDWPCQDFDLASPAALEDLAKLFASEEPVLQEAYGSLSFTREGYQFCITRYRLEGAYEGHRWPVSLRPAKAIEEDLIRRDFSINAMAYHPQQGLIDPFHGQKALKDRRLEVLGPPTQRFEEDALRILRALRFACRYGLEIEQKTLLGMFDAKQGLDALSAERFRDELLEVFQSPCFFEKRALLAAVLPDFPAPEDAAWKRYLTCLHRLHASPEEQGQAVLLWLYPLYRERLSYRHKERQEAREFQSLLRLPPPQSQAAWRLWLGKQQGPLRLILAALFAYEKMDKRAVEQVLAWAKEGLALRRADLALDGHRIQDLLQEKGPAIGRAQDLALEGIARNTLQNHPEALQDFFTKLPAL